MQKLNDHPQFDVGREPFHKSHSLHLFSAHLYAFNWQTTASGLLDVPQYYYIREGSVAS